VSGVWEITTTRRLRTSRAASQRGPTEFRNYLGTKFGSTPGSEYIKEMITYYDKI
jgi:hypothetical protein